MGSRCPTNPHLARNDLGLGFGLLGLFGSVDRLGVGAELRRFVTRYLLGGCVWIYAFSVRNTKKNTTQPIAEMKIQLTRR